ncbi:metallophosphoesterase family protein [Phreatobacter stygius]|uniref:Metallophosphoesterase family protein n=1 Tax=Phreatobacter stygius TaxID=1940610 RepID=A0A4D7B676_9HYPH|nr:metallophosphoesterase family protein [Phreatobacter stygius]QCI66483.1 metallophosphoesterase family protein [Phreatobacter stygius]
MRFAVIADVHGNVLALDAVLADIATRGVERIVNLGDCVSGPLWPRETCERLRGLGVTTVRGNHDRWVAAGEPAEMYPSDRYAHDALDDSHRHWLGGLPHMVDFDVGGVLVRAFHATPADDNVYLTEEVVGGRLALASPADIAARLGDIQGAGLVLCGHSHVPRLLQAPESPALIVNPGSVGGPAYDDPTEPHPHVSEAGSPHARYGLITVEGGTVTAADLIAVTYDWTAAADRAAANGRAEWARALATGFIR